MAGQSVWGAITKRLARDQEALWALSLQAVRSCGAGGASGLRGALESTAIITALKTSKFAREMEFVTGTDTLIASCWEKTIPRWELPTERALGELPRDFVAKQVKATAGEQAAAWKFIATLLAFRDGAGAKAAKRGAKLL